LKGSSEARRERACSEARAMAGLQQHTGTIFGAYMVQPLRRHCRSPFGTPDNFNPSRLELRLDVTSGFR